MAVRPTEIDPAVLPPEAPNPSPVYSDDNIKVYTSSFTAMFYSMMEQDDKGPTAYKLVCVGNDEKVVGMHILGLGSALVPTFFL